MSYFDHVRRLNARDLAGYLPFMIDGDRLGFVTPSRAAILARYLDIFAVQAGQIGFASDLISAEQRTVAMASIAADLAVSGAFFKIKGEQYAVKNSWHERARLQIDRGLGPWLWISRLRRSYQWLRAQSIRPAPVDRDPLDDVQRRAQQIRKYGGRRPAGALRSDSQRGQRV